MTEVCFPRLESMRKDGELQSFGQLMNLLRTSAGRVRASGKKVVAKGPLTPADPIYAAGMLPYDACTWEGFSHSVMDEDFGLIGDAQDAGLNPDFNPWNMVALGAVFKGKTSIPIDVYSTACGTLGDQVKKCWQIMAEFTGSPTFFWEIPRYEASAEKGAMDFLKAELQQLFDFLSIQSGTRISEEDLRRAVKRGNLIRRDLLDLNSLLRSPRVPISSLDYSISQMFAGDYAQDPEALHACYRALIGELEGRIAQGVTPSGASGSKPLRIYLLGEESQEFQLLNIIENYDGVLVGCDNRLSLYYSEIEESGRMVDNMAAWMWRMPHNKPTPERIKATLPHIRQQKPDALIISNVIGSRNLPGAERMARDMLREELGIPVLSIETTLPGEDTEKVDYQIRAFIETSAL